MRSPCVKPMAKSIQRLLGVACSDPQRPVTVKTTGADDVHMTPLAGDLMNTDVGHAQENFVGHSVGYRLIDRRLHHAPGTMEKLLYLLPGQNLRPAHQRDHLSTSEPLLGGQPRQLGQHRFRHSALKLPDEEHRACTPGCLQRHMQEAVAGASITVLGRLPEGTAKGRIILTGGKSTLSPRLIFHVVTTRNPCNSMVSFIKLSMGMALLSNTWFRRS